MAGPCSAETDEQVRATAAAVRKAGAKIFRGGAFKPRSSPYSFQGLGEEGLRMLREACNGREHGARHRSDGREPDRADRQVRGHLSGRRAQHAELHAAQGTRATCASPSCSSAALAATIEEWLMSAEYILSGGNNDVILCERGIRTFETATRNTFDISAIPVVKKLSHLPVVADPEPRRRAPRHGGADGARGGGRRRRRPHHRGAQRSGSRAGATARSRCSRRSSIG